MRSIIKFLSFFLLMIVVLASCQKEMSYESYDGIVMGSGTSEGVLAGDSSTCANIALKGVFGTGLPVTDSNKADVEINFTKAGTYAISTDTINGVYFFKSGTVNNTGNTRIELAAFGTPIATGVFSYKVSFKNSDCTFSVNVFDVATSTSDDYFPITTASNWTYVSSEPGAASSDTLRIISTGATVTISANNYNVFTQQGGLGLDSAFYRKGSGNYFTFSDIDAAGITTNISPAEYIFLKDNVAVGTTWESPEVNSMVDTVSVKIKLKLAVSEKNVNVLLDNKIYKNVIKVSTTEMVLIPGTTYSPVVSYESWYAKGIGLINIIAPAPAYGFLVSRYKVN